MKLPKIVLIAGREWTIKLDPKDGGGSFDGTKNIITIGTKYEQDILPTFLHEIIEAMLAEGNYRYSIYANEPMQNFRFVFDHEDFDRIINELSGILKGVIR